MMDEEIGLAVTRAEALFLRDICARVSGSGPARRHANAVFLALEAELGYDCLLPDGLSGELDATPETGRG
jgi:hypothetical protein